MFRTYGNVFQGNKGLVGKALVMAGGQLAAKSPNLQSPPNVSVAKGGVVDQLTLGSLPSSIASSAGLQSIASNGSSPQVMSSLQGKLVFEMDAYFSYYSSGCLCVHAFWIFRNIYFFV